MSQYDSKFGILSILLLFSFAIQGCAVVAGVELEAAAASGVMAYRDGELETAYAAPYNQTWKATIKAMEKMNLKVTHTHKGATEGIVESKQADGTKVTTRLKSSSRDVTSMKIRVGILGDEESSRTIDRYIRAELKK